MSGTYESSLGKLVNLEQQRDAAGLEFDIAKAGLDHLLEQRQAFLDDIDPKIEEAVKKKNETGLLRSSLTREQNEVTAEELIREHTDTPEEWVRQWYERLRVLWGQYDIEIPEQNEIQERLIKSFDVARELEVADPELQGSLGILLVPPTDVIGWPVINELRAKLGAKYDYEDEFQNGWSASNTPERREDWSVLVSVTTPEGIDKGTAKQILNDKKYMIEGYDTRAMGAGEYAALSLQSPLYHVTDNLAFSTLDRKAFTYLFKNYEDDTYKEWIPVGSRGPQGNTVFSKYGTEYPFLGGRFRPSVEIPRE
jgi:hypothetical protein